MIRESDREFPRPTPAQRHAPLDDRSRCAALQESHRPGSQTGLSRPPAHRESPRLDRRHRCHGGDRHGRTGRRDRDARRAAADEPRVTVGADKLYDTRGWVAAVRAMRVTPHVAQKATPRRQCHRRAHHATPRLRGQSAQTETGRAGLRVDEDRRAVAQTASSWRPTRRLEGEPSGPRPTTSCAGATSSRIPCDCDGGDRPIRIMAMNSSPSTKKETGC